MRRADVHFAPALRGSSDFPGRAGDLLPERSREQDGGAPDPPGPK